MELVAGAAASVRAKLFGCEDRAAIFETDGCGKGVFYIVEFLCRENFGIDVSPSLEAFCVDGPGVTARAFGGADNVNAYVCNGAGCGADQSDETGLMRDVELDAGARG